MNKKLLHVFIDLGIAFLLIKINVDDLSSYITGLCTMLIWYLTDKLFREYR